METLFDYYAISAVLFGIGVYGLVGKRNALRMLFAIEVLISAVNLNFVAFSRYLLNPNVIGQTVALFSIALAAAEAAAGLSIIIVAFRLRNEIDVSELKRLRG